VYHFPTRQQVAISCAGASGSLPAHCVADGIGSLQNASSCHISTNEIQIFPELRGTTKTELSTPKLYLPDKVPIITDHEVQQLEDMALTTEFQKIDELNSRITTHQQTLDLDTLLHLHHASQMQRVQPHKHSFVATSVSIVAILGVRYLYLRPYLRNIHCSPPKPDAPARTSSPQNPELQQQTRELREGNSKQPIVFASYPIQQAD